jgi:hypothetical protein
MTSPILELEVLFAAVVYVTVPLPTPDAPFVMVSQGAWLTAVHEAVGELAVRPTAPVTAVAGTLAVLALKEKTELPAGAPAWLTGKLIPAMVSDPVRAAPVFGLGPKTTTPVPLPDAPATTYRKELLLVAVQAHPALVVTSTLYVSAAAIMLALPGLSE